MPYLVGGRTVTVVGKDLLITVAMVLQIVATITEVIVGFNHSCHKIARMEVVLVLTASGEMVIQWLQEMVTAEMVLGRERAESQVLSAN
ncbi:hypothetical protein ATE40_009200 [Serratia surfactantfaciens]|nr:hypothetical protein ATE40_009200 [Serratia surfactantfaciens]